MSIYSYNGIEIEITVHIPLVIPVYRRAFDEIERLIEEEQIKADSSQGIVGSIQDALSL